MNKKFYFTVFKNLVHMHLLIFKEIFWGKCIDTAIWVFVNVTIMGYILQYFGLRAGFGVFQFGGLLACAGLWETYNHIVTMVVDFDNARTIDYQLTLPVPAPLVFVSRVTIYALEYAVFALLIIPLGKIALWNQLDLSTISWGKLFLTIIIFSIFYACFVLWVASRAQFTKMGHLWRRVISPLGFLGGFQFSWMAVHASLPWLSYITLFNPMVYVTEATRGAIVGQGQFINFWVCIAALSGFALLTFVIGYRTLKRRLDFV